MSDEMKPCPLCDGHPYHEFVSDGGEMDPYPLYRVVCDDCGAQGPIATDQEAIEKWNTRPIEDALRAEIERLRAEPVALDSSVVTLFGQPLDYWRELHQRVQNRGLTDIVSDCARLRIENEWLQAYADRLADALPEGGLPHDIETRRAANLALAQENHELRADVERLRQALTRIAERDNWQISEPDCYGGTHYEWIGDGGEAFEIAAAALLPEAPEGG